MALLTPISSPLADAIDAHYRAIQTPDDDDTLRCSQMGKPCDRAHWYSLHWTTTLRRHEGRLERLFETGRREEIRMVADLRACGVVVEEIDPTTGQQWRIVLGGGLLRGSCDGIVTNVPGAEKTKHLLEIKTHNEKSYRDWRAKGVAISKPVHDAQMQLYMLGLGLDRALYLSKNKNTDEIETERVKFDLVAAERLVARAARITHAARPPAKEVSYLCRFCEHERLCSGATWPRKNCRTCMHAEVNGTVWACTLHQFVLTRGVQKLGCLNHLFIPDLVPGEQIDADESLMTVTYRLANGEWVNGKDAAPHVPEIEA